MYHNRCNYVISSEIGEANGETGAYPAVLGFVMWLCVTPTSNDLTTIRCYFS